MARRVQKKKKALTRKQVSRVEKEQRQKRNIIIGTVGVMVVLVLLMLMGLYQSQVAEPRAERSRQTATAEVIQATLEAAETIPVVTVHGTVISLADWQARVRYERRLTINDVYQYENQVSSIDTSTEFGQQLAQIFQAEAQSLRNQLDLGTVLAGEVLDQMVEEELIRQEAQRRGVTVTPQELQEFIEVVDEFESELSKQTPGSVVTLTNVANTVITNELRTRLRELTERTGGISKSAAAVGITGFKRAIAVLLRRDLYYATSLEEAKDWLAE